MIRFLLAVFSCMLLMTFSACNDENETNAEATGDCTYLKAREGTTWTYKGELNYTTEIIGDTVINGRDYLVGVNDLDISYIGCSDRGITGLSVLSQTFAGGTVEYAELDLEANEEVGHQWQSTPITITYDFNGVTAETTVQYNFEIIEKGISLEVNGITYEDVVFIENNVTSTTVIPGFPSTSSTAKTDYYLAPEVSLIRSISYTPNVFSGALEAQEPSDLVNYVY